MNDQLEAFAPSAREIAHQFLQLPYYTRVEVGVALGVVTPQEMVGQSSHDTNVLIAKRIAAAGLVNEFAKAVDEAFSRLTK